MNEDTGNYESGSTEALYLAISAEIVRNEAYFENLKTNPQDVVRETAVKYKLPLTEGQQEAAAQQIKDFMDANSDHKAYSSALDFFAEGPPIKEIG